MYVIINPYYRSVEIEGEEVKQEVLIFPDYLNHLASISCTYDNTAETITDVQSVHRYVSNFIEKEYYFAHMKAFIDWFYAEKRAQVAKAEADEAALKKVIEDYTKVVFDNLALGFSNRIAVVEANVARLTNTVNSTVDDLATLEANTTASFNTVNQSITTVQNNLTATEADLQGKIDALTSSTSQADADLNTAITNISQELADAQSSFMLILANHNMSGTSHLDIRDSVTTLDADVNTRIATHNTDGSAHDDIRDDIDTLDTAVNTRIAAHNTSAVAHTDIRSVLNGLNCIQLGATLLTRVIDGITTVAKSVFGNKPLTVNATLFDDEQGTVGLYVGDANATTANIRTLVTSFLGTDEPTFLGNVATKANLPTTSSAASTTFGRDVSVDDYAKVITDGTNGGYTTEWYIINIDASGNITWGNSIVINTSDYQTQTTTADSGKVLIGGSVTGTYGTSRGIEESTPTDGSNALITSNAVKDAIVSNNATERTTTNTAITTAMNNAVTTASGNSTPKNIALLDNAANAALPPTASDTTANRIQRLRDNVKYLMNQPSGPVVGGVTPTSVGWGTMVANEGTSTSVARADHVHGHNDINVLLNAAVSPKLDKDGDQMTGPLLINTGVANQIQIRKSNYSVFLRNDGTNFYLLHGNDTGFNADRPLVINQSTGACNINGAAAHLSLYNSLVTVDSKTAWTTFLNAIPLNTTVTAVVNFTYPSMWLLGNSKIVPPTNCFVFVNKGTSNTSTSVIAYPRYANAGNFAPPNAIYTAIGTDCMQWTTTAQELVLISNAGYNDLNKLCGTYGYTSGVFVWPTQVIGTSVANTPWDSINRPQSFRMELKTLRYGSTTNYTQIQTIDYRDSSYANYVQFKRRIADGVFTAWSRNEDILTYVHVDSTTVWNTFITNEFTYLESGVIRWAQMNFTTGFSPVGLDGHLIPTGRYLLMMLQQRFTTNVIYYMRLFRIDDGSKANSDYMLRLYLDPGVLLTGAATINNWVPIPSNIPYLPDDETEPSILFTADWSGVQSQQGLGIMTKNGCIQVKGVSGYSGNSYMHLGLSYKGYGHQRVSTSIPNDDLIINIPVKRLSSYTFYGKDISNIKIEFYAVPE